MPLALFVILFQPPLLNFKLMHLVGLFSIIYICFNRVDAEQRVKKTCLAFVACFYYLFFVEFLLNKAPITCLVGPIYFLVDILPFSVACRHFLKRKSCDADDVINLFGFVCLVQVFLVLLSFFIPSLHFTFVNRMISYGYSDRWMSLLAYRLYGFSGNLTFATPVLLSFFSVVFLAVALDRQRGHVFYLISALATFFAALINARTSLIVLFVGCLLLVFVGKISIVKKVLFMLLICVVYFVFDNVVSAYLMANFPETYGWLVAGTSEISDFLVNGEKNQGYFSYITNQNIYRMPDFWGTVFGKGFRVMGGENDFGVHSDVGYINDIWFGGIFYMVIIYGIFFKCMYTLYKNEKKVISFIGLYLMVLYPILNFKGYIFSMNDLTNAMVILTMLVYNECKVNYLIVEDSI